MSKHFRWLGLLICVGLVACQSTSRPFSGQIKVTLGNGQDFSPSGTVVTLLEPRVVEAHLRRLHLDLDSERRTFETRRAQLQQDYDRVRQERSTLAYEGLQWAELARTAEESHDTVKLARIRADRKRAIRSAPKLPPERWKSRPHSTKSRPDVKAF